MTSHRSQLYSLLTVLILATLLGGCGIKETGVALNEPLPLPVSYPADPRAAQPVSLPPGQPPGQQPAQATSAAALQPTPTPIILGPLFDVGLDIMAAPVAVPLELKIPSLKVNAPVLGVGLTARNEMDAPKGPIDDPVWHSAYWYRGSGLPGESGTAAIAGHVNDPLGRDEIFAHLQDLQAGDLILIHYTLPGIDITFTVDQVEVYSLQESSDPAVLARIYGSGPVSGTPPQPSPDGLSHLTLITCAGDIVDGQFDHHVVVFATRTE